MNESHAPCFIISNTWMQDPPFVFLHSLSYRSSMNLKREFYYGHTRDGIAPHLAPAISALLDLSDVLLIC